MFSMFGKKDSRPTVRDIVWINTNAKWQGLSDLYNKDENTVFVFWFDETLTSAQHFLSSQETTKINLTTARNVRYSQIEKKPVVFAEHYPLRKKEEELFQNLHLSEVRVLSALDEPLFLRFGSEKIVNLMRQLGMDDKESFENSMITTSIENAQEKIQRKLSFEQTAQSQSEWFNRNMQS